MIIKTPILIILTGLLITAQPARAVSMDGTGCLSPAGGGDRQSDTGVAQKVFFRRSYDEAECLRRVAAAAGAEWRETEKLLIRSLEEAESGHWEVATQLVQKARFQAGKALQQAEQEERAWQHRVID